MYKYDKYTIFVDSKSGGTRLRIDDKEGALMTAFDKNKDGSMDDCRFVDEKFTKCQAEDMDAIQRIYVSILSKELELQGIDYGYGLVRELNKK